MKSVWDHHVIIIVEHFDVAPFRPFRVNVFRDSACLCRLICAEAVDV